MQDQGWGRWLSWRWRWRAFGTDCLKKKIKTTTNDYNLICHECLELHNRHRMRCEALLWMEFAGEGSL